MNEPGANKTPSQQGSDTPEPAAIADQHNQGQPLPPLPKTPKSVSMQSYQYATSSTEPVTHTEPPPLVLERSKSIKSEEELNLRGPLEVNGSVKSGGSINVEGDLVVRDKMDAYGAITINGNVSTE